MFVINVFLILQIFLLLLLFANEVFSAHIFASDGGAVL